MKSFQIFFSGVALLLLASLFACKNDKKNEPQGAKVESISFKQERYSVEEYQTDGINLKSELSIAPAAIADTCKITWELSNTDIATISNDGVITPKRVGWTKIFATVQDKKAECEYSVKEAVITKITVKDAEVIAGKSVTLDYTTEPVQVPVERLTFISVDEKIATVDANGEVTGVKAGEVTIKVAYGTEETTCKVKVSAAPVESVVIEPATATIAKVETRQFSAHVLPETAESESLVYTWKSSNTSVATVDENGLVTAKAVGTSDITVTVAGKSATCKLTVVDNVIHVTSVSVSPSTITEKVSVGATKQLTATVKPDNATDKTVTWKSSNTAVATVSSTGVVTCKGVGSATITANADGKSGTCSVTYNRVPVTSVSVSPSTYTADAVIGFTKLLSATVEPADATDKTVTWKSSNTAVATVSSSGVVTCKGAGTVTITATADGKIGTSKVTFSKIPVSSVIVSPSTWTAGAEFGATKQLTATVSPSNATDKTVTWSSSNTSLATVSSTGVVTCKGGIGTVTITAECGGKKGECSIKYEPIPVTSVTLSKTFVHLFNVGGESEGGAITLKATVKPDNATSKAVSWLSSAPSIASVNQNGKVIGLRDGETVISATAGGKTATCTVKVHAVETITDRQNNKYRAVKIGDQWWMTENLMCTQYDTESERKNEYIYEYKSSMSELEPHFISDVYKNWESTTFSGNLSDKQKLKLGLLYSWSAAVGLSASDALKRKSEFSDKRQGICPNGWYIPKKSDWLTLREYAGGESTCGKKLKSSSGWYSKNGEDYYFFEGLPSGRGEYGKISYVGASAYYWSASPSTSDNAYAWAATMTYVNDKLNIYEDAGVPNFKKYEMGVRCVKD